MLSLNTLMIGSENPKLLVNFYSELFQSKPGWEGGEYTGFKVGEIFFVIGPHDKVHGKSANPERLIYNFETEDIVSEFERVKAIEGANVIQELYSPGEDSQMKLATFADPDGNFFQLATPMSM